MGHKESQTAVEFGLEVADGVWKMPKQAHKDYTVKEERHHTGHLGVRNHWMAARKGERFLDEQSRESNITRHGPAGAPVGFAS